MKDKLLEKWSQVSKTMRAATIQVGGITLIMSLWAICDCLGLELRDDESAFLVPTLLFCAIVVYSIVVTRAYEDYQ